MHHSVRAPDSTQKLLLQLAEGRVVETVGIPVTDEAGKQRLTVCVSSQVRGVGGQVGGWVRLRVCWMGGCWMDSGVVEGAGQVCVNQLVAFEGTPSTHVCVSGAVGMGRGMHCLPSPQVTCS